DGLVDVRLGQRPCGGDRVGQIAHGLPLGSRQDGLGRLPFALGQRLHFLVGVLFLLGGFLLALLSLVAVLAVPAIEKFQVAHTLDQAVAGVAGLLGVGRICLGGGVVGRHGRLVRVGRVGKAGQRVGIDGEVAHVPARVVTLVLDDVGHFFIRLLAI